EVRRARAGRRHDGALARGSRAGDGRSAGLAPNTSGTVSGTVIPKGVSDTIFAAWKKGVRHLFALRTSELRHRRNGKMVSDTLLRQRIVSDILRQRTS